MSDKPRKVTLELKGERITAARFKSAIDSFFAMMDEVTAEVAGKKKALAWVVSVDHGSALITATPEPTQTEYDAVAAQVLSALADGANAIENDVTLPPFFTESAVQKYRDLAAVVDTKTSEVTSVKLRFDDAEPKSLSATGIAHVDKLLEASVVSYGSVEGRLQTITDRRGYKFFIWEDLTDHRVECHFDKAMADAVERAWRKRVSVSGTISYRKSGTPVSIRVESVRVLNPEGAPTWDEMKGILCQ
jgi:hypothetical protein